MDPLSDVLERLKPSHYAFRGLDAGGAWAIGFAASQGIKCYALRSGGCWIAIDGAPAPARLEAGDIVLVPGQQAVRLFSAADAPVTDAMSLFPSVPAGEAAVLNGGGDCSGVGGFFRFAGTYAELLLSVLPPIVHIRAVATRATLVVLIERLMHELREPQLGSALIAGHLAQMLLVEGLRLHLSEPAAGRIGWLFALADQRLRKAFAAMHADPARRWTLQDLAGMAGMSRSSFAERFRTLAGEPVMAYLTRWRMLLAADRLVHDRASVVTVATAVGYDSESAFGAAFKRATGRSPRQFARSA